MSIRGKDYVTIPLALCCFVLWTGVFLQTVRDFTKYPVSDLRNRVTGARRLADGLDPYSSQSVSLPERYRAFSPTSVSPAHLLLYFPLRNVSYATQRKVYFAFDWILVVACLVQLLRLAPASLPKLTILLIISIFFLLDNSLRLHFARGQTYLLLLLLGVAVATGMRYPKSRTACTACVFASAAVPSYLCDHCGRRNVRGSQDTFGANNRMAADSWISSHSCDRRNTLARISPIRRTTRSRSFVPGDRSQESSGNAHNN